MTGISDATVDSGARPRLSRIRTITSWFLVVLVSLLLPLSVMTVWVVNTVTNTDRYVETMAPIAQNPIVISRTSALLTDQLFTSVPVEKKIASILPKNAAPIAAALTSSLEQFVETQVRQVMGSSLFQRVWNGGNRTVHQSLVNVLSGEKGKAGRTLKKLGEVAVDISPVATKVIDALNAKGVPFFNSLRPLFAGDRQPLSVTLLSSQQVQTASGLFNAVKKLKWIVPIATLILAAAAAAVSVRRRHTLVRVAVGGSIGTVAFLVALDLVRRVFVSKAVAEGINGQVSGIIFDTLLRFLRDGLWLELAALLVLAVALWLVGPARSAVSLRHRLRRVGR